MNHAMYEHPATRANLATLRERGAELLEPGTGALGSPGEWGVGRLPEPAELLAAVERLLARAATGGGRWTGCGCWSPPAGRASRSTPCATSATAPRGAWASRSPRRRRAAAPTVTVVAANVAPAGARRRRRRGGADRRGAGRGLRGALRRLRPAADGRRRGRLPPGRRARRQAQEGRDRRSARAARSSAPPTCCPRSPPTAAPARRSSASPPSTAPARLSLGREKLAPQGPRPGGGQRRRRARDRLRQRRERGLDRLGRRRGARAATPEGRGRAAAVLEAALSLRSSSSVKGDA